MTTNVQNMTDVYNSELARYGVACEGLPKKEWPTVESIVESDTTRIAWTHNLKQDVIRQKALAFSEGEVRISLYRPFSKHWIFFSRRLNERVYLMPSLFPTSKHENLERFSHYRAEYPQCRK